LKKNGANKVCEECGVSFYAALWESSKRFCSRSCADGLKHRFFPKIKISDAGCWNWTGRLVGGYGSLNTTALGKSEQLAHRISWIIHNGAIPDGLCVLHSCDNPQCVNPSHLFLGTSLDNNKDRDTKHRGAKGDRIASSKLNSGQVLEIRKHRANGLTLAGIASMFGITNQSVDSICKFKTWKHV